MSKFIHTKKLNYTVISGGVVFLYLRKRESILTYTLSKLVFSIFSKSGENTIVLSGASSRIIYIFMYSVNID